ncbi:membrane protein [Kordiimonas sediminis]|uniref:Membrane protein n=1 Tax=Kordiimonas sediminis TaxID=1735581 RepID=A0A919ARJ5_9PROT|nr:YqaA family protein [Kordiimonas sediminis]GHF21039.1 membrane protein [Kordiimonas sediminis]
MMGDAIIYLTLFSNAFIAATLLPAFSELAFAALLTKGQYSPFLLFLAVTSGNILGACVNWWLGMRLHDFQTKRWFPFTPAQIDKASNQFARYGVWSLLFAWLPVIGDPLTLIAGVLNTRFSLFLVLVGFGKAIRYAAIWALFYMGTL